MIEYTTERGITIQVMPIPLMLDKVRAAHPEVPPVTYTEHLAGGAAQEVAITDEMAATWQANDPATWAEHAEKWAAYQAAVAERSQRVNDVIWKAILRRAIRVEMPKDDAWIAEQAELGLVVPEAPGERIEHYIWTEVIGGTRDIIRITALANGADLTEDALATAEAAFRDLLQGQVTQGLAHAGR